MNALKTWWAQRAPRERTVLGAGAALVALALLWLWAVAPALQTLRSAPPRLAQLEAQLAQMRSAQAEAQGLRAQLAPSADDARRQITQITRDQLGPRAQIAWNADTAQVRFEGLPPEALARWLHAVRVQAFATPGQLQIKPAATTSAASAGEASAGASLISGSLSIGVGGTTP